MAHAVYITAWRRNHRGGSAVRGAERLSTVRLNVAQHSVTGGLCMQDTAPFENRVKPIGFYPLPKEPANCGDFERVANASRPPSQSLLYIHIPFCRQRCAFCFFFDNLYREPQWR